uniref:Uncharacterized protein n=1 Tax=Chrysemys picta bellii TaxID=8478 RepID=A0A8C3H9I8_CHRPI
MKLQQKHVSSWGDEITITKILTSLRKPSHPSYLQLKTLNGELKGHVCIRRISKVPQIPQRIPLSDLSTLSHAKTRILHTVSMMGNAL